MGVILTYSKININMKSKQQYQRFIHNNKKKTIKMNIPQLTTTRLQISLQSIQNDPTVNENLKLILKNIYECIVDNVFNIELIQSELTSKCSSIQLNYGLSQKLSVGEFLEYFQKVENIIRIVQANQQKQQHKIASIFDDNVFKISKLQEGLNNIQKQWQGRRKIDELEGESIRNSIKQMIKKYQKVKNTLQVFQAQKQNINKSNMNGNYKSMTISKQTQIEKNINNIMQQMRHVQVFTQQMKSNIEQLIKKCNISQQKLQAFMQIINSIHDNMSINANYKRNRQEQPSVMTCTSYKTIDNKNKNTQCKYVTFTQLRQVLYSLQHNLTLSLNAYVTNLLTNDSHQKPNRRQHKSTKQSRQLFSQTQAHIQLQNSLQVDNNIYNQSKQQKYNFSNNDVSFNRKSLGKSHVINELTPSFNYRNFHSLQRSSKRDIISQIQQKDTKQSIKLQWIYKHEQSPDISIVRQKQNMSKSIFSNNHHLSYSFSKNQQSRNQPTFSLNSQQLQNCQTPLYMVSDKSVIINQRGFYQIRCGILPQYAVEVKIFCGQAVIASHSFHEIPKNNVCRAIMIYIKNYDDPSQITISCKPIDNQSENDKDNGKGSNKKKYKITANNLNQRKFQPPIQGFLCLQRLS